MVLVARGRPGQNSRNLTKLLNAHACRELPSYIFCLFAVKLPALTPDVSGVSQAQIRSDSPPTVGVSEFPR